jgi:hypothetical protein
MREALEQIIKELQQTLMDLDKVDAGAYGFKSAAPRVRKILMESTKKIKDLRTEVQNKKKEHESKD